MSQSRYNAMKSPCEWSSQDFLEMRKVGRGKFGEVSVARERSSDLIVALKKMHKAELEDNNFCQQIKRQILVQSSINHPNILKLYGYFWDSHSVTLILEYAPKGQLYEIMRRVGPFSESQVSVVLQQLCEGLSYLHSRHIIHRDIKPQNILVSANTLKIADFGWAVVSKSRRSTFCGTLDYLSPEMLRGEHHDEKVDVWAVGVLAFELATGKTPFEEAHYSQTLSKIVEQQILFPSSVSADLKMFIRKCLQKNPKYRPSACSLLQDPFLKKHSGVKTDIFMAD